MKIEKLEAGMECSTDVIVVDPEELLEFLNKIHIVILAFTPHLKRIAYTPIKELNEGLVELNQVLRELKEGK